MAPSWDLCLEPSSSPEGGASVSPGVCPWTVRVCGSETCCGQQHAWKTERALGMAQTLAAHPPSFACLQRACLSCRGRREHCPEAAGNAIPAGRG